MDEHPPTDAPEPTIDPNLVDSEGPDLYSPWAAASLVCMLLSFGGCLVTIVLTLTLTSWAGIAIFALPVLSLIAVITGVAGLIQTSRSGGRIGGRNAAIMGAVVGIMLMALQGSVVIGASIFWFAIANNIQPAMERFAAASSSNDAAAVRQLLAPASAQLLSDGDIASFWDKAEPTDAPGATAETGFDLGLLMSAREAMSAATSATAGEEIDEAMFPVRYTWADGTDSLVYVFADPEGLQGDSVLIVDVLIVNSAGEAVTLLKDGPAKKTAEMVGWTVADSRPATP